LEEGLLILLRDVVVPMADSGCEVSICFTLAFVVLDEVGGDGRNLFISKIAWEPVAVYGTEGMAFLSW
jgi:hypothetical protein